MSCPEVDRRKIRFFVIWIINFNIWFPGVKFIEPITGNPMIAFAYMALREGKGWDRQDQCRHAAPDSGLYSVIFIREIDIDS